MGGAQSRTTDEAGGRWSSHTPPKRAKQHTARSTKFGCIPSGLHERESTGYEQTAGSDLRKLRNGAAQVTTSRFDVSGEVPTTILTSLEPEHPNTHRDRGFHSQMFKQISDIHPSAFSGREGAGDRVRRGMQDESADHGLREVGKSVPIRAQRTGNNSSDERMDLDEFARSFTKQSDFGGDSISHNHRNTSTCLGTNHRAIRSSSVVKTTKEGVALAQSSQLWFDESWFSFYSKDVQKGLMFVQNYLRMQRMNSDYNQEMFELENWQSLVLDSVTVIQPQLSVTEPTQKVADPQEQEVEPEIKNRFSNIVIPESHLSGQRSSQQDKKQSIEFEDSLDQEGSRVEIDQKALLEKYAHRGPVVEAGKEMNATQSPSSQSTGVARPKPKGSLQGNESAISPCEVSNIQNVPQSPFNMSRVEGVIETEDEQVELYSREGKKPAQVPRSQKRHQETGSQDNFAHFFAKKQLSNDLQMPEVRRVPFSELDASSDGEPEYAQPEEKPDGRSRYNTGYQRGHPQGQEAEEMEMNPKNRFRFFNNNPSMKGREAANDNKENLSKLSNQQHVEQFAQQSYKPSGSSQGTENPFRSSNAFQEEYYRQFKVLHERHSTKDLLHSGGLQGFGTLIDEQDEIDLEYPISHNRGQSGVQARQRHYQDLEKNEPAEPPTRHIDLTKPLPAHIRSMRDQLSKHTHQVAQSMFPQTAHLLASLASEPSEQQQSRDRVDPASLFIDSGKAQPDNTNYHSGGGHHASKSPQPQQTTARPGKGYSQIYSQKAAPAPVKAPAPKQQQVKPQKTQETTKDVVRSPQDYFARSRLFQEALGAARGLSDSSRTPSPVEKPKKVANPVHKPSKAAAKTVENELKPAQISERRGIEPSSIHMMHAEHTLSGPEVMIAKPTDKLHRILPSQQVGVLQSPLQLELSKSVRQQSGSQEATPNLLQLANSRLLAQQAEGSMKNLLHKLEHQKVVPSSRPIAQDEASEEEELPNPRFQIERQVYEAPSPVPPVKPQHKVTAQLKADGRQQPQPFEVSGRFQTASSNQNIAKPTYTEPLPSKDNYQVAVGRFGGPAVQNTDQEAKNRSRVKPSPPSSHSKDHVFGSELFSQNSSKQQRDSCPQPPKRLESAESTHQKALDRYLPAKSHDLGPFGGKSKAQNSSYSTTNTKRLAVDLHKLSSQAIVEIGEDFFD